MSCIVLVTGASSHLGEHLLERLRTADVTVLAGVRSAQASAQVRELGALPVKIDLEDPTGWDSVHADVMIHAAGIRHSASAVALAEKASCIAAVCVSSASASAVGHPLSDVILDHERKLLASPIPWNVVRPTMIFGGARDQNVRLLARVVMKLPAVPRFSGGELIQPVFVDDVAAVVWEAAERALYGGEVPSPPVTYGGTRQLRIGELVDDLCCCLSKRRAPVTVPVSLLSALAGRVSLVRDRRLGHAVVMLATRRVAEDPSTVGFVHAPKRWEDALPLALQRYREVGGLHDDCHTERKSRT